MRILLAILLCVGSISISASAQEVATPLSAADVVHYKRIFDAQEDGNVAGGGCEIAKLQDRCF